MLSSGSVGSFLIRSINVFSIAPLASLSKILVAFGTMYADSSLPSGNTDLLSAAWAPVNVVFYHLPDLIIPSLCFLFHPKSQSEIPLILLETSRNMFRKHSIVAVDQKHHCHPVKNVGP